MNHAKSLLPKNALRKIGPSVLLCLSALLWVGYFFTAGHLNTKINQLETQQDTLTQYQEAMKDPNAENTRLIYMHHITSHSQLSFNLMSALHSYPSIQIISMNKKPEPPKSKHSRRKMKAVKKASKPISAAPYMNLLPGQAAVLTSYHLELTGPYRELSLFLGKISHFDPPLLIQKVTLVGNDYPVNHLNLDLAFFSRGA